MKLLLAAVLALRVVLPLARVPLKEFVAALVMIQEAVHVYSPTKRGVYITHRAESSLKGHSWYYSQTSITNTPSVAKNPYR
jgi:hypothetical protein